MTNILIEGGQALIGNELADAPIYIAHGKITEAPSRSDTTALRLDSHDLIALPGIVDMHGDAFERQMMPRPGVDFPIDVALVDSDRQAIANGITDYLVDVANSTVASAFPGAAFSNFSSLPLVAELAQFLKLKTPRHESTYSLECLHLKPYLPPSSTF